MKKFLTLFLFSLMIFTCKGHSNTERPKTPDNPTVTPDNPLVVVEDATLKKAILKHFDLLDSKDENKTISYAASGACKKIVANVDTDDFKLSSVEHLAYDDELGTFKIKVTGSIKIKDKMESFSNRELLFENFEFPLKDKTVKSIRKFDINMTEAEKHKPSVENFLKNCTNPVTSLIFILSDDKDCDFKNYGITAKIVCEPYKAENAQIATGVKVGVIVNQLKKEIDKQETSKVFPFDLKNVEPHLIRDPLFEIVDSEKLSEAKKAIANLKEQGKLIKVDKDEYASSYWAGIHYLDKALPIDFMTDELQAVLEKYRDDKITIGIVHSACEINLKADDFKGTLKIPLVVATTEDIADQKNLKDEFIVDLEGFKTVKYEVKDFQEGENKFKAFVLNDENFKFISREKNNIDDELFNNVAFGEYTMYNTGVAQGSDVISVIERKFPYHKNFTDAYEFVMNGETKAENVLGFIHPQKYPLCKTINDKEIFIKNIKIYKKSNTARCTVKITFMGELQTEVGVEPIIFAPADRVDP